MGRLLWPELEPEAVQTGFIVEIPAMSSSDVYKAIARRHPMDGWGGEPGRWVFVGEVSASTGSYGDVQRFDAVAVGLVPSVKYARVVYEIKVSRADWLHELKPIPDVRRTNSWSTEARERREAANRARQVVKAIAREGDDSSFVKAGYRVAGEYHKWDAALVVSTEFWVAAPPQCVLVDELPPEAGLLEIRAWGRDRELRARVIRQAPVRRTPLPDEGFWAAILRRTVGIRPPTMHDTEEPA